VSYYFCKKHNIRLIDGEKIDHDGLNLRGYFTLTQIKDMLGIKNKSLYEAMDALGLRHKDGGKTFPTEDSGIVLRTTEFEGFYGYKPYYIQGAIDKIAKHLDITPTNIIAPSTTQTQIVSQQPRSVTRKINESLDSDGWEVPRFVTLFDTETTGFSKRDTIVSFAYIHIDLLNREFIESDEVFSDPRFTKSQVARYASSDAYAITGIKIPGMDGCDVDKFVSQEELGRRIMDSFTYYRAIMAHNISFDKRMINQIFDKLNIGKVDEMDIELHCSMSAAKKLLGATGAGQSKLDSLCDRFNIDRSKRVLHGALLDIELMAELLYKFMDYDLLKIKDESYNLHSNVEHSNSGIVLNWMR